MRKWFFALSLAAIAALSFRSIFAPPSFVPKARPQKTEIVISAAASLKNVLTELGANYQKTHPQIVLRFNLGSSGALQKQIEAGARVDLFLCAADENMDELAAKNLILKSTRANLARNKLVLIVPKNSALPIYGFKDVALSSVQHVAVGAPGVPAGNRAQEVFTKLGIWKNVNAKAVRGKDVRAALAQVEMGNVEAGIVYRTDALASSRVRIVAIAPTSLHAPIRYPLAVVAATQNFAAARTFARYLTSAQAQVVLKNRGFVMP